MQSPPLDGLDSFVLCNGTPVTVRPLCPGDAAGLRDLVSRLSPESRYLRFFSARCTLLPDEALRMATIDYRTHMGYAATTPSPDAAAAEPIIATACYSVRPHEPAAADFAVMVEDRYQGLGLGAHLLGRLAAYAGAQGLASLCALVHAENGRMLRCLRRTGLPLDRRWLDGLWAVTLALPCAVPR